MTQQISELMDGELDGAQCDAAIRVLARDEALRGSWRTYHLIGDVLRGESVAGTHDASAAKTLARLAAEPTILAPRGKAAPDSRVAGRTRVVLAMAASVATLSVVGVIATRQGVLVAPQAGQQMVAQQAVTTAGAAAPARDAVVDPAGAPNVNDYLVLHRQFSNPDGIQQATMLREARVVKQGAGR